MAESDSSQVPMPQARTGAVAGSVAGARTRRRRLVQGATVLVVAVVGASALLASGRVRQDLALETTTSGQLNLGSPAPGSITASTAGSAAASGYETGTETTIPPEGNDSLVSVDCTSTRWCMAIGLGTWGGDLFSEVWNGSAWKVVATAPGIRLADQLYAVSCTSSTNCFTVGSEQGGNLIEHWNGAAWSAVASPSVRNTDGLSSVSCSAPAACIATGANYSGATFVERWDGRRWSLVQDRVLPAPPSYLGSVSCLSASSCVAVGDRFHQEGTSPNTGTWFTLGERWNGATWSALPIRDVAGANGLLNAVACSGPAACTAVGDFYLGSTTEDAQALAERWDGSTWTITPVPHGGDTSQYVLNDVSCGRSADCVAVGSYVPAPRPGTEAGTSALIEHWDGSSWSEVSAPIPPAPSVLLAVSCVSPAWCVAVGDGGSPGTKTLVERWNGRAWAIIPSPSPSYPGI